MDKVTKDMKKIVVLIKIVSNIIPDIWKELKKEVNRPITVIIKSGTDSKKINSYGGSIVFGGKL